MSEQRIAVIIRMKIKESSIGIIKCIALDDLEEYIVVKDKKGNTFIDYYVCEGSESFPLNYNISEHSIEEIEETIYGDLGENFGSHIEDLQYVIVTFREGCTPSIDWDYN